MPPPAPRTQFNQSSLVRLLDELARPEVAASRQSFGERLGQWLDVNDAIVLASVLAAGRAAPADSDRPAAVPPAAATLPRELATLRAALAASLTSRSGAAAEPGRVKWPAAAAEAVEAAAAVDFLPYHRYYLARQREIETRSTPLRGRVRAALAAASPTLRALAMLDAALDQALGARARQALAGVPLLLERRFRHLQADAAAAAIGGGAGAWLDRFGDDLHVVLRAEADLRLQPLAGMIEALNNEMAKQS